jgi:hypothetical protein
LESSDRSKVIVNAVDFSLARQARRVRNGKAKLVIGKMLHEHLNKGALSNTRRATKHNGPQIRIIGHGCRFWKNVLCDTQSIMVILE